jgi:hypothetical protein
MSRDKWVNDVLRPLAVAGMMGCITVSLVHLIQLFVPGWRGAFMVVGSILAAVEAHHSYHLVRSRRLRGPDMLRFRIAELAMFLLLLRVGAYLGEPWQVVVRDVLAWPQEPWRIVDLEVLYAFFLVLISWSTATKTSHDLERIGEPPIRDKYYVPPVEALVNRFFLGGILLLSTSGLVQIGISNLLNLSRPSVPGLILNVLIYFVLGLLALGQVQFTWLSERWRQEGLDVPTPLARRWVRYMLILLGLAGLMAFLLPTAYTLPLLDLVRIVIGAILYIFNVIFQLVMLLFFLLLAPLVRLLGGEISSRPPESVPPPSLPPVTPRTPSPPWFDIVRSLAFWAFALAAVWYIVRSYLRDRPELMVSLRRLRPLRGVRHVLQALWQQLTRLAGVARERIPGQLRRLRKLTERGPAISGDPFRFFRLGALSRRERTFYYYLSILRRAARHGYPRDQSQTPYEYDTDLGPNVPQVEVELDRLTDAFVEVRYSEHEVDKEREERVRADWKRIRAALRSLRRRTDLDAEADSDERE